MDEVTTPVIVNCGDKIFFDMGHHRVPSQLYSIFYTTMLVINLFLCDNTNNSETMLRSCQKDSIQTTINTLFFLPGWCIKRVIQLKIPNIK